MDTKANLIGIKANAMPWNWVPPAGWDEFLTNYAALQSLSVPSEYARVRSALLNTGAQFARMYQARQTIENTEIQNWLLQAHSLASRLRNAAMESSTATGMNRPDNYGSDADRYYDQGLPNHILERMDAYVYDDPAYPHAMTVQSAIRGITAVASGELETIAIVGIAAIAGLVLLPHLFRGGER